MSSSCFEKACDLLALRPHFRAELERKLSQKGYDEAAIAGAVEKLGTLGYLDDAGCAKSLAAGPLSRRGYGPLRMRAELERRGAPAEEAAAAVADAFGEGEGAAARGVAERWLSRRRAATGTRAALARHLGRKGYSSATVLRLVRELAPEADD